MSSQYHIGVERAEHGFNFTGAFDLFSSYEVMTRIN